jgi:hypothetical protein
MSQPFFFTILFKNPKEALNKSSLGALLVKSG